MKHLVTGLFSFFVLFGAVSAQADAAGTSRICYVEKTAPNFPEGHNLMVWEQGETRVIRTYWAADYSDAYMAREYAERALGTLSSNSFCVAISR